MDYVFFIPKNPDEKGGDKHAKTKGTYQKSQFLSDGPAQDGWPQLKKIY